MSVGGCREHHRDNNPISLFVWLQCFNQARTKGRDLWSYFTPTNFFSNFHQIYLQRTGNPVMSPINFPRKGIKQTCISLNSTSRSSPSQPPTPRMDSKGSQINLRSGKRKRRNRLIRLKIFYTEPLENPWNNFSVEGVSNLVLIWRKSNATDKKSFAFDRPKANKTKERLL